MELFFKVKRRPEKYPDFSGLLSHICLKNLVCKGLSSI
jgi:hypothetical protein